MGEKGREKGGRRCNETSEQEMLEIEQKKELSKEIYLNKHRRKKWREEMRGRKEVRDVTKLVFKKCLKRGNYRGK